MRSINRFTSAVLVSLALCATCFGAFPYNSVAELLVREGDHSIGGSGTLIATSDKYALVLTCRHVVQNKGRLVKIRWSSTGESVTGRVLKVGKDQDIALVICPRPHDLRPVPFTLANTATSGPITNVGYPGVEGRLEWQRGDIRNLTDSQLFVTCRPIPGMSGGATFDRYGNLIGVITHYQPNGGISSSGPDMTEFILSGDETDSSELTGWVYPEYQKSSLIEEAAEDTKIKAPESSVLFALYMYQRYTGPDAPSLSSPITQYAAELDIVQGHVIVRNTCQ